jgi:hypothetical protein
MFAAPRYYPCTVDAHLDRFKEHRGGVLLGTDGEVVACLEVLDCAKARIECRNLETGALTSLHPDKGCYRDNKLRATPLYPPRLLIHKILGAICDRTALPVELSRRVQEFLSGDATDGLRYAAWRRLYRQTTTHVQLTRKECLRPCKKVKYNPPRRERR